ncbi:glycosyltransferase [Synechococcus sp. MIT S9509]|uniref:glycosyltransferase n=1 Tax=Synechococcus sp. MIT S9509 TaxID=1801630 RepID=UPI00082CC837|nr:glycosyltransferase [Synechococcus sp. MIT S9509]
MFTSLHILGNNLSHDSRVLKETESILKLSECENLFIAALHEPGYLNQEVMDGRHVWRPNLLTRKLPKSILFQILKYIEWNLKIFFKYHNTQINIIHCHDLIPLPIAVQLKLACGAKLIYDAHELETEMNGLLGTRKLLAKILEFTLYPFVDQLITVSPSIGRWYEKKYKKIPIEIVRNVPLRNTRPVNLELNLRRDLGIDNNCVFFIYLGGLSKGRGIEVILDSFADFRVKHHVLFMGSGILEPKVNDAAKHYHNIHFRKPVPVEEIVPYAACADVGLCLYEDTCLNHRFCMPNKLFEYLLSGLPVLASNLPDLSELVLNYSSGWISQPTSDAVKSLLVNLSLEEVKHIRQGLANRVSTLSWESEEKKLCNVYKSLLNSVSR